MIQAFFDGSTQDGEVLVVAGYLSTVDRWLAFTDEWQALLDLDGGRPFKMSRAAKTAKGMRRARAHFEVADKWAAVAIGCIIPIEPIGRIVRELGLPKDFNNPYYIAWRMIISSCFAHLEFLDRLEFIFDDQTERSKVLDSWDEYIRTAPLSIRRKIAGPPNFKEDDDVLPLQAADLIAWWGRKSWLHDKLDGKLIFPAEWMAGKQQKAFFYRIPEEGIREQFQKDIELTEERAATLSAKANFTYVPARWRPEEPER